MLKISIPIALRETANRISRALDSDVGGYHVFDFCTDEEAGLAYTTIQECDPYAVRLTSASDSAEALHAFVAADYAARWPEHEAPTLADCEAFLAELTIEDVT